MTEILVFVVFVGVATALIVRWEFFLSPNARQNREYAAFAGMFLKRWWDWMRERIGGGK